VPQHPSNFQEGISVADQPSLAYDVEYPDHLSRLLIFFKWLLVIPHFVVLLIFGVCLYVTTAIAWFAILFTGKYPRGLFDFALSTVRYYARISAYTNLMRDEYPPFGGGGSYPVTFELSYPESLSRWKIFVKPILLIPHLIIMYLLGSVAGIVTMIAWLAILFTGKYPPGLFTFSVGVQRWTYRIMTYAMLLTDAYPPFSMEPMPATSGYASGMA
jgi:hypothetical protein